MEPERAARRRQLPNLTILLQTRDAGKTWRKSEASVFGQVTRISLAPQGIGLGLVEYKDEFDFPSEVYRDQYSSERRQRQRLQRQRAGR